MCGWVGGWVWVWVCGLVCARGCVFVCGCVSMTSWVRGCACGCVGVGVRFGTGLCAYVVGWPPHILTHTNTQTQARTQKQIESNTSTHMQTQPCTHAQTTNPHTPHKATPTHTCTCCLWPGCMHGCMGGVLRVLGQPRGVDKSEIWKDSYEFRTKLVRNSYEVRTKFTTYVRINAYGSVAAYGSVTGLPLFATVRFGRRLGVVDAFGAGLSLDDG